MSESQNEITTLPPAERAALALGSTKTESELREMVLSSADILAVVDANGRDQAHAIAMRLRTARTTIEKTGKAARDDATKFGKAVIAEEKRLIDIITPEETRVLALRDAWDAEQQRIKDEAIAAERRRTEAHEANIAAIVRLPADCAGFTSEKILSVINAAEVKWDARGGGEAWEEFADRAQAAYGDALDALRELNAAALAREEAARQEAAAREAERQRIAAEQAELARQRAEQAEQARVIAEQQAALRREQEAVAEAIRHQQEVAATKARAEEAERQRVIAAEVAERKRQDDERAAAIEKQAAELRAAQEAFAAQQRVVEEAKAAAIELEHAHAEALELNAAWQPPAPPAAEPEREPVAVAAPLPDTEPTDMEIIRAYQESFGGTEAQCVERLARFTAQYALEAA